MTLDEAAHVGCGHYLERDSSVSMSLEGVISSGVCCMGCGRRNWSGDGPPEQRHSQRLGGKTVWSSQRAVSSRHLAWSRDIKEEGWVGASHAGPLMPGWRAGLNPVAWEGFERGAEVNLPWNLGCLSSGASHFHWPPWAPGGASPCVHIVMCFHKFCKSKIF